MKGGASGPAITPGKPDRSLLWKMIETGKMPVSGVLGNIGFGEWPSRYVLNMEPGERDAWIKQVTGNASKDLRRQQTLLQAEYERYRQALAGGTKMTAAERAGLARDVANDPDADAPDPTAKKSGPSDAELERMYPDLAQKAAEVRALVQASEKIKPNYIWALWDVSKNPSPTHILMRSNYGVRLRGHGRTGLCRDQGIQADP
jgi:hypothetical protein